LNFSIAEKFDLDIYIFNLFNINDNDLKALFVSFLRHYIVFLKDIDVVNSKRSIDININPGQNGSRPSLKTDRRKVSLSILFNVLDDIGLLKDRMLIITINYIERLDETFIRSGCADKKFEFQLADEKTMVQLFRYIFLKGDDPEPGKIVEDSGVVGAAGLARGSPLKREKKSSCWQQSLQQRCPSTNSVRPKLYLFYWRINNHFDRLLITSRYG